MSTPIIFSSVRGAVAQTFVEQIPSHINKADFFDRTCKEHNMTLEKVGSDAVFSFEGQWIDFLRVEAFLQKHLMDWYLTNQISNSGTGNNDSPTVCQQTENNVGKKSSAVSFNRCASSDALSNSTLQSGLIVTESDPNVICSKIAVSQEKQYIDVIDSSGNENNLNNVCFDKSDSQHEKEIYMDIKLSCRPPNGLFKDSGNAPVTLVMGTEESLMETVCLESANNEQDKFQVELENLGKDSNNVSDWKRIRSKKYEERAQFRYFCSQCSFKSKRQSHLKKHSLLHERVCKLYSCDHCDFSTIRLGHLQRHVLEHSQVQLTCSACNYKTHSKALLQKHQNVKHKVDKFLPAVEKPLLKCSECHYSTTKEKLFQRHQSVHADAKNMRTGSKKYFECSKCPFKTNQKSNLGRHSKNVHMDVRPFLCNICGQSFKRSDTLRQHLVVHAGSDSTVNQLQCPHCKKFYRSKNLLHEHILVHSDARSYLCEMCGAAFKTRAVQRKHVHSVHTVHTTSKLISCNHCSKKFNSNYALKRHMKLHEPMTNAAEGPGSPKSPPKSADQWGTSVMTLPIPEDVQVLVVQQEDIQQGVLFNEGTIFVQDSGEIQMESTSDPSHVSELPLEYVLPQNVASQVCTATNLDNHFSMQDGEVITLQFVQ